MRAGAGGPAARGDRRELEHARVRVAESAARPGARRGRCRSAWASRGRGARRGRRSPGCAGGRPCPGAARRDRRRRCGGRRRRPPHRARRAPPRARGRARWPVTARGALQAAAPAAAGIAARASRAIRARAHGHECCNARGRGGLRSYNPPPDGAPPGRPAAVLPRARGAGARALARARRLPRVAAPPRGRRAVGLLRGPADRQRPPGLPPRARARVQGHLPALPDDARLLRRAQGRLGLPRPAGRDRGRAASSASRQARDRGATGSPSSTQRCRESVFELPRGLERADRADRLLDRPRRRLPHARHRATSSRSGGRCARSGTRACSTRATRSCPYCPRCGTALSSHEVAPGYQDVDRPVGLRALPGGRGRRARCRPATSCSSGRPRRGRSSPTPRSRSTPSSPTCARRSGRATRRSCSPRRSSSACSARAREVLDRFPGAALDGVALRAAVRLHRRPTPTASAATPCCSATSSPPTTAPASCTPRSPSARTTSASASSTA